MPLVSPVPGAVMSTRWRKRPRGWPLFHTYWRSRGYHTGADWSAPTGAPVLALNTGVAVEMTDRVLGRVVLLLWTSGVSGRRYTSWYCHLDRRSLSGRPRLAVTLDDGHTEIGYRVSEGDALGVVGNTGAGAMGSHLHVEKRRGWTRSWSGKDLDPMKSWGH